MRVVATGLTSFILSVSIDVVLELCSDLAFCRLVLDEWMFEKLIGRWTLVVVLDETNFDETLKFF